jgi:hypothetical protein
MGTHDKISDTCLYLYSRKQSSVCKAGDTSISLQFAQAYGTMSLPSLDDCSLSG